MKIRSGFVSNSSSSSFYFGFKKDIDKDRLREIIKEGLKKSMDKVAEKVIDVLLNSAESKNTRQMLDDFCCDDIGELPEEARLILHKFGKCYWGSASDQDSFEERLLCEMDINHVSDDFIIKKEGGY